MTNASLRGRNILHNLPTFNRANKMLNQRNVSPGDKLQVFTLLEERYKLRIRSYIARIVVSLGIGQITAHTLGLSKYELNGPKESWQTVGSMLGKFAVKAITNMIPEEKLMSYGPLFFAIEVGSDIIRFSYEWKVVFPQTSLVADPAPVVFTPIGAGITEVILKYGISGQHKISNVGTKEQIESSLVGIYGNTIRIVADTLILIAAKAFGWSFKDRTEKRLGEIDNELRFFLEDELRFVIDNK